MIMILRVNREVGAGGQGVIRGDVYVSNLTAVAFVGLDVNAAMRVPKA